MRELVIRKAFYTQEQQKRIKMQDRKEKRNEI